MSLLENKFKSQKIKLFIPHTEKIKKKTATYNLKL